MVRIRKRPFRRDSNPPQDQENAFAMVKIRKLPFRAGMSDSTAKEGAAEQLKEAAKQAAAELAAKQQAAEEAAKEGAAQQLKEAAKQAAELAAKEGAAEQLQEAAKQAAELAAKQQAAEEAAMQADQTNLRTPDDTDVTDDCNRVIWKSCSSMRISSTLAMGENHALALELGLGGALSIPYDRTNTSAVMDFALGFDGGTDTVEFRGKTIRFERDMLSNAFNLPTPTAASQLKSTWDSPVFKNMFRVVQKGFNPYSVASLKQDYESWVPVIRLVQEVILGKSKSTQLHTRDIWYFWAHWWERVPTKHRLNEKQPRVLPDWTSLVFDTLKREILSLKMHLLAVANKKEPKRKRFACYCGIAVTRILRYEGWRFDELLFPVLPREQELNPTLPGEQELNPVLPGEQELNPVLSEEQEPGPMPNDIDIWRLQSNNNPFFNDVRLELKAAREIQDSLNVALMEKERKESELLKQVQESKQRETDLENDLAQMWVLVAQLKKEQELASKVSENGLSHDSRSNNGGDYFPNNESKVVKVKDIYEQPSVQLEDVQSQLRREAQRSQELETIILHLKSEQLDDLDLDTLYELQNVHVEALAKLCQAKGQKQKKLEKERLEKDRMEKERERERQTEFHAGPVGSLRGGIEQQLHKERSVCKVCFESPIAAVLLPCRHFCLCKICAVACTECPLCRSAITDRIVTFAC